MEIDDKALLMDLNGVYEALLNIYMCVCVCVCDALNQGCTNLGYHITVAPNVRQSVVWNLLHDSLLAPRIFMWLLDWRKFVHCCFRFVLALYSIFMEVLYFTMQDISMC
jgi:hypothetical protein